MKIKLDENLPNALVPILSQLGHDTDTVVQEGLRGKTDETIWKATQAAQCFFITQDLDFSDIHQFMPGTHHGILVIRLRDPGRNALLACVQSLFKTEPVETWQSCFVMVTDNKIRLRRPEK